MLLLLIVFSLVSCSQSRGSSENHNSNTTLSMGTYILQTNENRSSFLPSIVLKEDGSFTFTFSPLMSTIPSGTYNIKDNQLILSSEVEGKPTSIYIFNIDNGTLIFDSINSDALIPELWTERISAETPFILLSNSSELMSEDCNRKIFRRIKRPPSQRTGKEMAVCIFIMVLEFYISGAHSPGGKIPPRLHPSGSAQVRCSEAKPGSGRDPDHSPLRFQSDCRSQRWTERRPECWKRANSSGP